jgi:glycine cleavage system H lipoate-binding protein
MRCPFLREAHVQSCRASSVRKMIAQTPGQSAPERCTSNAYHDCAAAKPLLEVDAPNGHCPFLHDSLVQYCGAASLTKYIPYSEAVLSHCGTESHNYCELFLAFAHPGPMPEPTGDGDASGEAMIDGVRMKKELWYAANHMWAEVSEDGIVHCGVDGFLAGLLGSIDRINYVTVQGVQRPTVVFTVNGTDVQMVFPLKMQITGVNTSLRTYPARLFSDPYTHGWLFEGSNLEAGSGSASADPSTRLITGSDAVRWMTEEVRRVAAFVHGLTHQSAAAGMTLMADGGVPQPGVARQFSRDHLLQLFNEFFSPLAGWRRS